MKIPAYHEDLAHLHVNTLPCHAYFIPFQDRESALRENVKKALLGAPLLLGASGDGDYSGDIIDAGKNIPWQGEYGVYVDRFEGPGSYFGKRWITYSLPDNHGFVTGFYEVDVFYPWKGSSKSNYEFKAHVSYGAAGENGRTWSYTFPNGASGQNLTLRDVWIPEGTSTINFSPGTEGTFRAESGSGAKDLRTLGNDDLASLIGDALSGGTDVRLIEADGKTWYAAGSLIRTVGWSIVTLVDKELTDQPTLLMEQQHSEILSEAKESFYHELTNSRNTIFVLLAVTTILALTGALMLAKRIVKPLRTMTDRVLSLGGEDLQFMMEDTYRTGDEVQALAESFANLSARTLQYVDKVRSVTAEKERIGTELALATNIQASMLPHIFPAFPERPEFDIYASMDPAKEVGGDFYDYFLVDDNHLCMVIADVSGKGVPAALFMMASKIILQSAAMQGCSPEEILRRANDAICSNNEMQMFVTVWLGILELSTGKLIAANAGHEIPVVRRSGGRFELYKDKHGFVIGGLEGMRYRPYEIMLEPGSKLFVYTDGVAEATSENQELFGTERMINALNADPDATPEQLLKNVRTAVDDFVKDAEQFDDLTMLCLEYRGM